MNYICRTENERRYQYLKYLNPLVFPHASNFIMETEGNSKHRRLYDFYII